MQMYFSPWTNINNPLQLRGDATLVYRGIQNLIRHNGLDAGAELGWPQGSNFWDFPPIADSGNLAILWLLALPFDNPFLIANLFFLGTFVAAFLMAYLLMRSLSTSQPVSALLAVAFAFLPYHHDAGIGHLFLSNYAVLLLPVWICLNASSRGGDSSIRGKYWFALLIGLAVSIWGVYYALFSLCYLAVAAVAVSARRQPLAYVSCAILGGLVGLIAQVLNVVQRQTSGLQQVQRLPNESDMYSLKSVLLFTPSNFGAFSELYPLHSNLQSQLQLSGEATSSTGFLLSVVAFIAFILFARDWQTGRRALSADLRLMITTLIFTLILFMTIAPSLLGLIGLNEIRVWSRASILVSAVLLFIAGHLLDSLLRRRRHFPHLFGGVLAALLVVGAAELIIGLPDLQSERELARDTLDLSEDAFSSLSAEIDNPVIFQLPIVPFPEYPRVNLMWDYDHFIPTLIGDDAKWSYGAVKFVARDTTCEFPSASFLDCVRRSGFNVVWIDSNGYIDEGLSALRVLQDLDNNVHVLHQNERYITVRL